MPEVRPALRPVLLLALVVLIADQATKLWVLHILRLEEGPVPVLPFMNLTLVWNRGISYGLFQQSGTGRWILVGFTLVATAALSVWLARATRRRLQISLALIVGGAIGNLIDRVYYGAVVDFVHLFYAGFSWYVFNIADAAIVFGVIGLLADSVLAPKPHKPKPHKPEPQTPD